MPCDPKAIGNAKQSPSTKKSTVRRPKPTVIQRRTMSPIPFVLMCIVLLAIKDISAISNENDGSLPEDTSVFLPGSLQRFDQDSTAIVEPHKGDDLRKEQSRNRRSTNQDVTVGSDLLMMQTDGVGAPPSGSGEIRSQVGFENYRADNTIGESELERVLAQSYHLKR